MGFLLELPLGWRLKMMGQRIYLHFNALSTMAGSLHARASSSMVPTPAKQRARDLAIQGNSFNLWHDCVATDLHRVLVNHGPSRKECHL